MFHKSSKKLSKGIMINGGTGATVIGDATVTLPFSDSLFDEISSRNNERIDICKENDFIKITAKGIGKHSALPEGALSALAIVAELLSDISELRESDREIFQDIFEMSSCYYGEFFEIQNQDEEYGKLTCVLVKIETFKDGTIVTSFNIRYGEQISKDEILYKMEEKLKERGWGKPVIKALSAPQAISLHSPYVKSLLEVYGKYTDNENPECYINAGGTYRQYLKNAVEIGTTLSWERDFDLPEGHGAVHQPDEYININGLLEAIELTTLMVIEIDKII